MSPAPARIPSKPLFLSELGRILGRDDLDDDTRFDEIVPDSIAFMEVVTFLSEYSPAIEPGQISECETIGGLYRFIALGAVDRTLPG